MESINEMKMTTPHIFKKFDPFEIIFDHVLKHFGPYLRHTLTNVAFWMLKNEKIICENTIFHVASQKKNVQRCQITRSALSMCYAASSIILLKPYIVQVFVVSIVAQKKTIIIRSKEAMTVSLLPFSKK